MDGPLREYFVKSCTKDYEEYILQACAVQQFFEEYNGDDINYYDVNEAGTTALILMRLVS